MVSARFPSLVRSNLAPICSFSHTLEKKTPQRELALKTTQNKTPIQYSPFKNKKLLQTNNQYDVVMGSHGLEQYNNYLIFW